MKKNVLFYFFCLILVLNISYTNIYAQYDDVANFLKGGATDAEKLMEAYLNPYANAFSAGLTGGWYNTASVHSKLGFDITATINGAFVPASDKEFNFKDLTLKSLELSSGSPYMVPTAASKESGIKLETIKKDPFTGKGLSFNTPDGTKIGVLPIPMVQAGIGLLYGTELNLRYFPKVNIKGASLGLWGVGVKHDLKQWIPVIKRVPILHLAFQVGYTQLNSSAGVSFGPNDFQDVKFTNTKSLSDQKVDLRMTSFTANLLVSANIPVVCVYGGIGVVKTGTNLKLTGNYPTGVSYENEQIVVNDSNIEKDPIDMKFGSKPAGGLLPRLNIGLRLKLGFITIHGDYTYTKYNLITAGLGIAFR